MRDVLDDEIAELYPAPGDDDARLARLREQLFAERPERRSRTWINVAAAAVAVVMITGLVVLIRPVSRDATATAPMGPATSLLEAAALLEVADQPPPGRYQHIRYVVSQPKTADLPERKQADAWVPAVRGEAILIRLEDARGQRVADSLVPPDLLMPVDPRVGGSSCTTAPCLPQTEPLAATKTTKLGGAWWQLLSPYTTNGEKAATYRELAAAPEVRWDNGTVSVDGERTSLLIDPATGRIVGSVNGADPGQKVSVTYEWTDQRPS